MTCCSLLLEKEPEEEAQENLIINPNDGNVMSTNNTDITLPYKTTYSMTVVCVLIC